MSIARTIQRVIAVAQLIHGLFPTTGQIVGEWNAFLEADRAQGRMEALWRLVFFLPLVILNWIVGIIMSFIVIPWWILDIIVQGIFGGNGLPGNNLFGNLIKWLFNNTMFVVVGEGSWQWTPAF